MGVLEIRRVVLLAGAAVCFSAGIAQGQAVNLPPVVVTSPTTLPTDSREIASSVTVITGADLERDQLRTVPDALRAVPGLNVVQTGGPGGQTSVFMRGTNSSHVKVFIDGIEAGDPSSVIGAFDFAHLLTGDIERIEVLRGPQSGLYGSDAIGGVISITTKKGEGPPKVSASVEAGSFSTFNQTASLRGAQGNINYAFNVLHYRSASIPVTPLELLAPGTRRNNDLYDNKTYSGKVGVDLSDNLTANFVARFTDAKLGFTGDDFVNLGPNGNPEILQSTQLNRNLFTRSEMVWSLFGGRFKNYFGVNYSNQWALTTNPNADSFNPFGAVNPPTRNVGIRTKYDWRGVVDVMPGQVLVVGAESQRDTLTNATGTAFGAPTLTGASNRNHAGYLELQSEFAKRFFLVSNVRYDNNEAFGSHTTWRLAPAFLVPGTDTKLKATYGTGFKTPTLSQLFVNNPAIAQVANPGLLPEESIGYDFGFEQPVWNDRVRFGATYFHNRVKNLIVNQFDPVAFTFSNRNVGSAMMQGVEAFIAVKVSDELSLRGDYTLTNTRDQTTDLGLLRRPANKISATAIWMPVDQLTLSATVVYVGSGVDVNRDTPVFIPRLDTDAYTTVNLAANYNVNKNVTVFARADNLFNKQYQVPTGFLRPGLGVYGGIRVSN